MHLLQKGDRILPRDEPELTDMLTATLRGEGVEIDLGVDADRVQANGHSKIVEGTHEGLGLDAIGVATGPGGVPVDDRLRTSIPSIYAAGDVAGRFLFTHSAGYEAVLAVRNMFFPGASKPTGLVPWCTFTDPELAHAGLTVAQARGRHGDDVEVSRADLARSDRARADGTTEGRVVLVTVKGRLVGAPILSPVAGEMIHEPALAIHQKMRLRDLAGLIHVYPTR